MNIQTEQTWGVQINRRSYGKSSMPEACPPWIKPIEKSNWQKKGRSSRILGEKGNMVYSDHKLS